MGREATIKAETHAELAPEELRWRCPLDALPFTTTDEISACTDTIGQPRALRAIQLGLEVKSFGYNLFVTGLGGTGRNTTIKGILESLQAEQRIPNDHLYVNNFKNPDTPRHLSLAAGHGRRFKEDMAHLITSLKKNLPRVFESETYQERRKTIVDEVHGTEQSVIRDFEHKVNEQGFALIQVQMGPLTRPEVLPVVQGNPVPLSQVESSVQAGEFPRERFEELHEKHDALNSELRQILKRVREAEKQLQGAIVQLENETVQPYMAELIDDIKEKYDHADLRQYLDDVLSSLVKNLERFRDGDGASPQPGPIPGLMTMPQRPDQFTEYEVNLIVDHAQTSGPPVIVENHPTYKNLFGAIERVVDSGGMWRSDFTHVKAGSLLRADGGYLVINAVDALLELGVWPTLKRTLRNGALEIQNLEAGYIISTTAMKPEPIPLDLKVVMIGEEQLYELLNFYDEVFRKIFKVKADFDSVANVDAEIIGNYACFVKKICEEESLLPFDRSGVAGIIEHGVRRAGRQSKISTRFAILADVVREANYWAECEGQKVVTGAHVTQAIKERILRVNLIEEKIQEHIDEGTILIDSQGAVVGQVNGLAVYSLGEYAFGKPSRITATTGMGRSGIINIEREADMSGKTHNKGVYILSGYLRAKYAQDKPMAVSASVCFEQSYSGVDGDSASSTEIYALLSSLSGLALRQDIAVTGSVNQHGEVQPIGGVNEKIEGFYDVCRAKGLTGDQGVMIPALNTKDLMLRHAVVKAVRDGQFHIYPVQTIDAGIEILTGVKAGARGADGAYDEITVNRLVDDHLAELANRLAAFGQAEADGTGANGTARDEK